MLSQDGTRQQIVKLISGNDLAVDSNLITQDISQCKLNGKVVDNQGNMTVLNYTKEKKFQKTTITLNNIVRNENSTTVSNTYLQYDWQEQNGTITDLNTTIFIKGEQRYVFSYSNQKRTTTITEKAGKVTQTKTIKGFVVPSIKTEGDSLKVNY